jgi:hypothetical protein
MIVGSVIQRAELYWVGEMIKDDARRAIIKHTEIKKNILNIATDVFRDTQVLFGYQFIHNYQLP